ncbi:MAG TPA: polysaccharide deacetylase [Allosphingosinicella sp.]|jgi:peptidoglycan/xylan/chitin deacetylase (PgdA/CDA1 family)
MPTRILLTIDTELRWGPFARGASWQENLALSYDPAGVGIPHQLDRLAAHGLKACFFVDPMPALVHGIEPIRRMVEPILAAGQEVQLHLHPAWADPRGPVFELAGLDRKRQLDLIRTASDRLVEAGASRPIAFRAGSYAADFATIEALREAGISYDSSHNGSQHPWASDLPLDPRQVAPVRLEGVTEVPVSQIDQGKRGLRHLQVCAVSFAELRAALLHADRHAHPVVTIVGHSFELAARGGDRPNPMLVRRFERLCGFLAEHRERLPTAHFADLADVRLDSAASPLRSPALRTAARMAQQLWGNAVYERAL